VPLQKIQFRPGVNREGTDYSNEGGWYACDKVRFRSGFPEKIGGWIRLSNDTFLGVARALWNWVTLNGANLLGVGTNLKYYLEQGGGYNDITPLRVTFTAASTPNTVNCITTTNGSNVITLTIANYGGLTNDFVTISGANAIGTITAADINQEHQIAYISTTQFSIVVANTANTTVTAGGGNTINVAFQVNTGLDTFVVGTGWGAGTWPTYIQTSLTNPFTCTSPGTTVTVTQTAHGLSNGNAVYFNSISGNVCGLASAPFVKAFSINVVNANAYTFSTVIGGNTYTTSNNGPTGGTVVVSTPVAPVRGWGAAAAVGIGQQLRLWTNDNFGEDLMIAPRGGAVYYWDATLGVTVRAVELSTLASGATVPGTIYTYQDFVPNATNQIIGSSIQRFAITFGSNPYDPTDPVTAFDPLLVRWSDQENPFDWVPSATNQSGEYRLNIGSFIMCAESTRQEILVWSDAAIYSMQYLGPPYVWGFQLLQDNISVMGPNATITVNNVTYWMGVDKFFSYTGRVETLPCTLWKYVFEDINKDQAFQVFAGSNEAYSEVWWFYCSENSNTIDKYVIYNYLERVWSYGTMERTAWLDSPLRQYPMAAYPEGNKILFHEANVDDVSGLTPVPIESYIQSSDFDIGDGHNFGFVWRILPDITFNGSNVNEPKVTMTVRPRRNSGAPYGLSDSPDVQSDQNYTGQRNYDVQLFDGQVYTRLRGRQMAFKITSTDLGVAWQLGSPRIDIRNDGRR
jgi:hypothetical protein